ncbi:hypothetical protein ACVU7I_05775, partial [Patulibacter sp. S7RM1-6]
MSSSETSRPERRPPTPLWVRGLPVAIGVLAVVLVVLVVALLRRDDGGGSSSAAGAAAATEAKALA